MKAEIEGRTLTVEWTEKDVGAWEARTGLSIPDEMAEGSAELLLGMEGELVSVWPDNPASYTEPVESMLEEFFDLAIMRIGQKAKKVTVKV